MKTRIIVARGPYEEIGPEFPDRIAAELWAHETPNPDGTGGTVADAIEGGDYEYISTQ
jgi:hypothetical protein